MSIGIVKIFTNIFPLYRRINYAYNMKHKQSFIYDNGIWNTQNEAHCCLFLRVLFMCRKETKNFITLQKWREERRSSHQTDGEEGFYEEIKHKQEGIPQKT